MAKKVKKVAEKISEKVRYEVGLQQEYYDKLLDIAGIENRSVKNMGETILINFINNYPFDGKSQ